MNFSGKINLLSLTKACIVEVKGKNETKKGVFIPIDENNLYVSMDEERKKAKSVYMDVMMWEKNELGKFGDTHSIRLSYPKKVLESMTDEQKKAIPFVGEMKPFETGNGASSVKPETVAQMTEDEDLPF